MPNLTMLAVRVFLCLWLATSVATRITKSGCDQTSACIQKSAKYRGHQLYCFHPDRDASAPPACTDRRLGRILQLHVHGRHDAASCGYYDIDTAAYLGPAHSYYVQRNSTPVALCFTGLRSSTQFYTTCRKVHADDEFSTSSALETRCDEAHELGKRVLHDRCVVNPPVDVLYWLLTAATLLGVPLALLNYAAIIGFVRRWLAARDIGP